MPTRTVSIRSSLFSLVRNQRCAGRPPTRPASTPPGQVSIQGEALYCLTTLEGLLIRNPTEDRVIELHGFWTIGSSKSNPVLSRWIDEPINRWTDSSNAFLLSFQ